MENSANLYIAIACILVFGLILELILVKLGKPFSLLSKVIKLISDVGPNKLSSVAVSQVDQEIVMSGLSGDGDLNKAIAKYDEFIQKLLSDDNLKAEPILCKAIYIMWRAFYLKPKWCLKYSQFLIEIYEDFTTTLS